MDCEGMSTNPDGPGDLDDIVTLLAEVALLHEGVAEHLGGFLVARDGEGRLAGAIGIERHGSTGLLR